MPDKPKDLVHGDEALAKMKAGLDKLSDAVKVTLGPRGRNVIIEREYGSPSVTKDGVSVAKEIELKDPVENLGAQMAKDVASKTCDEAGDGTTTATVLAQSITAEGSKVVISGGSPIELKRGMDLAVNDLEEGLRGMAKPADDRETIARVGAISANNEKEVGDTLAEAIDKVGQTGVVTIEESSDPGISLELIEGLELSEGLVSPVFLVEENATEKTYENPLFFLVNKNIESIQELLAGLEDVNKLDDKPHLVIIAHSISKPALNQVLFNLSKGAVMCSIVRVPGFGDKKKDTMRDLAVSLGAELYGDPADGCTKLSDAGAEGMGQAGRVKMTMKATTIFEPLGDPEAVLERVTALQDVAKNSESEYDKEKILERVARLSGAMAVVNVGGRSEVEAKELRDRVEDAMHATRAAVEEGIVPGGGTALLRARSLAKMPAGLSKDQKKGYQIVMDSIEAPLRNILINADYKPDVVVSKILEGTGAFGFNAHTGVYEDLLESGVIDPVKVTVTALRNSVSIAGMLLTSSCAITRDRDVEQLPDMSQF